MSAALRAYLPSWIVPVVPEGRVLTDSAIVVEGVRIRALVNRSQLEIDYPGIERIELPGHALMPGLINMHTHSALVLMRGLADDRPLMQWLHEYIWPAEKKVMGPDYVRFGSRLAMAEMLRGGTTCFNDNYFFPDVTAEAAVATGMRAFVGMPVIAFPTAWADTEDEYFRRGLAVHQRFVDHPLIGISFVPHAPYSVSDGAFRRIRTLSEELDITVHLHLLEAPGEIETSRTEYGMHPLDRLQSLELLGPRLLAVHMTQLQDADIARLAREGVHVIHCPDSNMKLASGICPVAALDRAGVNVSVGTDSAASNNNLDLLAEVRQAALLAKVASGDPEAVPAARALSMATIHGARALGMEHEIGSLEPGKQADFITIDLDCIETRPLHDVVSQLVYATPRCQVTNVWVRGRQLLKNRELITLDEAELRASSLPWQQKIHDAVRKLEVHHVE
ncbi:MAG: TRZ/ATZ family hydrolase [Xanthomonadaceae bacterium]|nr:TRZ/ATZ family hydrolase [Xanthomonadaceae bacterium]